MLIAMLISIPIVILGACLPWIFRAIRKAGAPWCSDCRWAHIDFISVDDAAAFLSERGVPKDEARRHLKDASIFQEGSDKGPLM